MSLSRETSNRLQEAITKMTRNYSTAEETKVTDFHVKINGETGDLSIADDDSTPLAHVHILEWEKTNDEAIYEKELRSILARMQKSGDFENLNIAKPYSFVLDDDDDNAIVDLLIVDDDTMMLNEDLLAGFDEEMDEFLKHLLEE